MGYISVGLPWWPIGKESTYQFRRWQVQSLGWEDPLEKEMVTHSSILAWEVPWTEKTCGLQSIGSKRVRHDLATKQQQYQYKNAYSEQSTVFSGTSMLVYCSDSVGQCNCKCFTRGIFSALSSDLYYTHTTCTHMCIYIFSFQILAQAWTQQWSERKMCCSC